MTQKLILCFTKILEHWVGYNQHNTFSLVVDNEVFLISKILRAGCNEIESNIVIVECVSWQKEKEKECENKTTK